MTGVTPPRPPGATHADEPPTPGTPTTPDAHTAAESRDEEQPMTGPWQAARDAQARFEREQLPRELARDPMVLAAVERAERAEQASERDAAELAAARLALTRVRLLAEEWRYKGEFGWGPWQTGEGPDQEGYVLDMAATQLLAVLEADQ